MRAVSRNRSCRPAQTLRRCLLFSGCPAPLLRRIAAIATEKPLGAGQYLFHEGCAVQGMYVIRSGAIKVHRFNSFGREQVLHVYRENDSFAEESLLSGCGHPACAVAIADARLLVIRRPEFLDILREEPELALGVLRSMNRQLQGLMQLLDDLTLKDVKTRLANWLLQHCPDPGSPSPISIRLPSTKRMLAAELGTVSETLSRTVAKFREQKLLSVEGDLVTLHCPRRLTSLFPAAVIPVASAAREDRCPGWVEGRAPGAGSPV
jgi:CRP/FNR family transcriptional regulator